MAALPRSARNFRSSLCERTPFYHTFFRVSAAEKNHLARVKAMIRRNREYQQTVLNLANVTLDLESNEISAKSGSLILSVKEAKFLALFLEKEDISYSVEEIAGQVFQGEVSAEEISLYMAYLNNKLVQIHGNLQLMMEDGKISAEKKEG